MAGGGTLKLPEVPRQPRMTAQQYAYQRLRHSLMVGAIPPGRAVTIRGLAETLGVSPTPIRESLGRLSSDGAITVLENRRVMVPAMHSRRFEELVALRCSIECHAAERALPYVSDMLIEDLARIDARMGDAMTERDYEALVTLNQRFHAGLYAANPEQVVMPMVESVWLQLGPFQRVAAQYVTDYYPIDRHEEILVALRKRDPIALGMAVEADIRDGVGRLGREAIRNILKTDAG